jgi:hypothetical protein
MAELCDSLRSADGAAQLEAAMSIRRMLLSSPAATVPAAAAAAAAAPAPAPAVAAAVDAAVAAGVVPRLAEALDVRAHPRLQCEAARALMIIAASTAENIRVMVAHGVIARLIALLGSPDGDTRARAACVLVHIGDGMSECRDDVLHSNALPELLQQIRLVARVDVVRDATAALARFCR